MNRESLCEYERLPPETAAFVDAVCDRFEQAWKATAAGSAPPILTAVLADYTEAEQKVLIEELIALDEECRKRYGSVPHGDNGRNLKASSDAAADADTHLESIRGATVIGATPNWPNLPGLILMQVIGSGGMGVVYRARQPKLDREVAVKLLRDAHLGGSGQRERFLQEARAIARLQHPHLVQLYEFGEAPNAGEGPSTPYLILEYVAGGSLADRLRGSCLAPGEAALLVETLAGAIHYAHQQGIIHRDLKPANVLLAPIVPLESAQLRQTPYSKEIIRKSNDQHVSDAEFRIADFSPKVTDFGLAKFLTGSNLTQTGDVLGTPCYMAPEQATGKPGAASKAVDVYGLGAILYELLTGRPPFVAATVAATVFQLETMDPVSPRRLRRAVPRDLETICLKCLRKEPGRRYASAHELADDLRRFLVGEPIRARPVGAGERALGWCRRKPLVAGLVAALAFVFLAGLSGVAWQRHLASESAAETARTEAKLKVEQDLSQHEKERADRNVRRLKERVDRLAQLGLDLWELPKLRKTALALLEETLALYQELLPEEAGDPRLRQEAVRMYGHIAHTYHSLGQWDKAVEAFRIHAELLERLRAEQPGNKEYARLLAPSHRSRGNVLRDLGEPQKALEAYDQAAGILEQLLREPPNDPIDQVSLANTLLNKATVLSRTTDLAELERVFNRIVELNRAAAGSDSNRPELQAELAMGLEDQGAFYLATGRLDKAKAAINEALAIYQKLLANGRLKGSVERYAARCYANHGRVLAASGSIAEAERSYKVALKLHKQMVTAVSTYPFHRAELAQTLASFADLLDGAGRKTEVEDLRRQAIAHHEMLKRNFPQDKPRRRLLVRSYLELADLLCEVGRPSEAAEPLDKALDETSDDPDIDNDLAWFLVICRELSLRNAAAAQKHALKAVKARPKMGEYWNTLGVTRYRNGDDKGAIADLETSMKLRAGGDSFDWFFLALAYQHLGDHAKARDWFDRAVDWTEKHRPNDTELRRIRMEAEAQLTASRKS